MPYSAEISRSNPTCFLFMVDQSGSMKLPFGRDQSIRKSQGVADAINRLLYGLVLRCTKGEDILDRYFIGVMGYGHETGSALKGDLEEKGLMPVSEIGKNPLRVETRTKKVPDGAGGIVETTVSFPLWLEANATGKATRMCRALADATTIMEYFAKSYPKSYPPIVINITDGVASDGDPVPYAKALRAIATEDGNLLLFNVHISSEDASPIELPVTADNLPNEYARRLYRMSSLLPPKMVEEARSMEMDVADGARGFVFNADLVSVIQFLDIGTRTAT